VNVFATIVASKLMREKIFIVLKSIAIISLRHVYLHYFIF